MIETLYVVRCSGPCGLGLAMSLGQWMADDLPEIYDSRAEAEQAARDADWWPEPEEPIVFPECRAAMTAQRAEDQVTCPACRAGQEGQSV